ncbi:aldehyde dehydrogenase family protein [Nocardia sp. SYP-A9097]|uniref:aldehyde dehydrogenase family protein n=1 Tax=Nocardia sp. SYP-A9097 TaxID=2663237 RepID=UPI00129B34AC|nr:aldehyde dehydrogenase family protein [Nocardia sp. SYP-A9097]MRH89595.1 aldehyde dehydrogenase family protein [Nocardia sp. SYP-A9097]
MRTALSAYSEVSSAGKVGSPMLIVIAPADGRVIDTVPAHTPASVRDAVDRLRDNSVLWRSLGVVGRVHWLYSFRNWLQDNRSGLTTLLSLETGKPEIEADAELALTLEALDHYRTNAAEFLGGRMPQASLRPGTAMQLGGRRLRAESGR